MIDSMSSKELIDAAVKMETPIRVMRGEATTIIGMEGFDRELAELEEEELRLKKAIDVTPEKIKELQNAKIIFAIGEGTDNLTESIIESINGAEVKIVSNKITLKTFSDVYADRRIPEALKIEALGYKITTKNDKHFLEIDDMVKSQEWKNDYIDGNDTRSRQKSFRSLRLSCSLSIVNIGG